MAGIKYSRQRHSIKDYLASTTEHPTAETIYLNVKDFFPHISLGTVYRNLNLLIELNQARKILTPDGRDRFDGITTLHSHFYCTNCGRILDLNIDNRQVEQMNHAASEGFEGIIESSSTLFYGKCNECIESQKITKEKEGN